MRFLHFGYQNVILFAADILDRSGKRIVYAVAFVLQYDSLGFQSVLEFLVQFRPEYLPEDLFPVIGRGKEQFQKIPLRDHSDL